MQPPWYGRYLYFQFCTNSARCHPLRQHSKPKSQQRRMLNGLKWNQEKVHKQINLFIPQSHFVYVVENLHSVPHGDEIMQLKPSYDSVLKSSGVSVVDVSTSTTAGPLRAFYSDSELMTGIASCVGDIDRLQQHLFDHLFDIYQAGTAKGRRDSSGARVDFGLSQIQPTSMKYSDSRSGLVHRLPFCNLKSFLLMYDVLKTELSNLLLYFHQQVNKQKGHGRRCNDDLRSELVLDLFRNNGWNAPFVGFEYMNLSLRSEEDPLHKHFDSKNDRRNGYTHAVVYSFLRSHNNCRYRVVLVCTFRTVMGSFMDDLRNKTTPV